MAEQRSIRQLRAELDLIRQESEHSKDIAMNLSQYFKTQKDISKLHEQINKQQALWNKINESANESLKKTNKLLGEELKEEEKILSDLEDQLDIVGQQMRIEKSRLAQMGNQLTLGNLIKSGLNSTLSLMTDITGINLKNELSWQGVVRYLIEQQKSLKQLNLQLGISGEKSKILQESISNTSFQTQILGKGLKDIVEMITAYGDESGRARLMTEKSQQAISEIAAGTHLSNVEAGRLAAQFSEMGVNAIGTNKEITGVLDTAEKMGLNTDKILKSISENFKALSKFHFKRGIKELSELVVFSTKFKQDIGDTLGAMEKGRYLDSVIEMSAQLRLAGGSASAIADPFKLLFAARNSPEKFAEMVKDMTKDVAQLNKEGEFEIMATGFDRLKIISEATSIPVEKLAEQARRTAQLDIMKKSIPGFIKANKNYLEMVEGQAEWNQELRRFEILDPFNPSRAIDIKKISEAQLKSFHSEQQSLSDRAKIAQSFDQVWQNLVNTIKSSFLPILEGLNWITSGIQKITEGVKGLGPILTMVLYGIGAAGFMGLGKIILGVIPNLISMNLQMKMMGGTMGKFSSFSKGMPKGGIMGSLFGGISPAGMLKGAAAMVLVGASLIPFAYAMTLLKDVGWKQFGLIAAGIGLMTAAVVGLGAIMATGFGAAAIVLGAGAIALMGASLIPLAYSMKELGEANIPDIGFGFQTLSSSVNAIDSSKLEEIQKTAEALRNLSVTAGLFGGLGNLFQDGITVKFKDNQVQMVANITAQLDKDVLVRKLSEPISVEIESGGPFNQRKLGN